MRQPPAFAEVAEIPDKLQRLRVVDKSGAVLPRHLKNLSLSDGDAFAEILRMELRFLSTVPLSSSTLRTAEFPFIPVPSYRKPSKYSRPCVYAFGSCG